MKKLLFSAIFLAYAGVAIAQTRTFDLITYPPPKGWTEEEKKNVIVYTRTDMKDKSWCQIGVYRSTTSNGSIEADLESEWKELVLKQYSSADSMEATETQEAEGWKIKVATGKFTFEQKPAAVMLTTFSGYDRCVSIIAITNSGRYISDVEDFIGKIDVKKPEPLLDSITQPGSGGIIVDPAANAAIAGTWIKAGSVTPTYGSPASWGVAGSTKDQYTFNADGTYVFYSKSFAYAVDKLILVKEKGRYTIQGNTLVVRPATSVVESWSKKDGTDQWGRLIESVKRDLEPATYTFTRHYFSGIQQWNLILQTPKPTNRDGSYGQNPAFENAYFFAPPASNNTPIELPPGY